MDSLPCKYAYKSGLCPGASNIKCCMNPDAETYYLSWGGHTTAGYLENLDDALGKKVFPSKSSRDSTCSTNITDSTGWKADQITTTIAELNGKFVNSPWLNDLTSSTSPNKVNLAVILVRRDASGSPKFKYYGNGAHQTPFEPWSSTKIFAAAAGAAGVRELTNGSLGLDGIVQSKSIPLGDLVTIICSYDTTQGLSSNGAAKYMASLGSSTLEQISTSFLGRDAKTSGLCLSGSYGEVIPSTLGYTLCKAGGACCLGKTTPNSCSSNSLSAVANSELLRRLVMGSKLLKGNQFPRLAEADRLAILYGSATGSVFPKQKWGGMTADTSIYFQQGLNMSDVELRSGGNWRIFSKLGAGISGSRQKAEIVENIYACLPGMGPTNQGVEVIISARSSVSSSSGLQTAENQMKDAIKQTIKHILNGNLGGEKNLF